MSNSRSGGVWGTEQREAIPGKPVVLAMILQEDAFEVAVTGKHFTRFEHRVDPVCRMVVMTENLTDITIEYY